jgi:hypothetical protein
MPIEVRLWSDFVQESPYFQARVSECETEPNRGSVKKSIVILKLEMVVRSSRAEIDCLW